MHVTNELGFPDFVYIALSLRMIFHYHSPLIVQMFVFIIKREVNCHIHCGKALIK